MNHEPNGGQLASLIKMVNQIAANMPQQEAPDQNAEKVAAHIRRFWPRSMKRDIIQYAQNDGDELSQLAKLAVKRL